LQYPTEALKKGKETNAEFKEEAVNKLRIDCKLADRIVGDYRKLLELAQQAEPARRQLTSISSILGSELL
jgi:hypothetical protein